VGNSIIIGMRGEEGRTEESTSTLTKSCLMQKTFKGDRNTLSEVALVMRGPLQVHRRLRKCVPDDIPQRLKKCAPNEFGWNSRGSARTVAGSRVRQQSESGVLVPVIGSTLSGGTCATNALRSSSGHCVATVGTTTDGTEGSAK